jgi:glycosyltransferase involved in cell wall biosynthesis
MISSAVTVVVPTYNGETYIGETLDSVFDQTVSASEVIVVDDCSTDNTIETVRAYSKSKSVPITIVALGSNSGGPARPMNVGIQKAKTEYIAVLDQDDLYFPWRLETALRSLEANPDASMVCGNYFDIDANGNRHEGTYSQEIYSCFGSMDLYDAMGVMKCFGEDWLRIFYVAPGAQRSCSNHFFRKSAWSRIGGYRETAHLAADYDFVVRIFDSGILWLLPWQFKKRYHGNNYWVTNVASELKVLQMQDKLAKETESPAMVLWRNELMREKAIRLRWRNYCAESRRLSIQLIRNGCIGQGILEYTKSLSSDVLARIRNMNSAPKN